MSTQTDILKLLEKNRGIHTSGAAMARALGVSRNAVWKAINALKAQGYSIEGRTNKGYCLSDTNDILSPSAIAPWLEDPQQVDAILVYPEVTSTNTLARERAAAGAPAGTVIIAENQSAGRGRMGRSFYSPSHTGLYFSIILRPQLSVVDSLFLTIAASVRIAEAIESVLDTSIRIKWVNDLFNDTGKVAGILTEASANFESGMVDYVVLGVGINLLPPKAGFPDDLRTTAGTLSTEPVTGLSRSRLAAALINHLNTLSGALDHEALLSDYRRRSNVLGKRVRLLRSGDTLTGLVKDFNTQGHLLLLDDAGVLHTINSGEVSLRLE